MDCYLVGIWQILADSYKTMHLLLEISDRFLQANNFYARSLRDNRFPARFIQYNHFLPDYYNITIYVPGSYKINNFCQINKIYNNFLVRFLYIKTFMGIP